MLKYLGLAMILAAGVIISREYEKWQNKRLCELREFIRLFEHIKSKISCFLSPKADWLSDFSSESEALSEFLFSASYLSLPKSFEKIEDKLSLGEEGNIIKSLFSSLGRAYKDGEIALLEEGLLKLQDEKTRLSTECEKNIKTVRVLATAASLGLVILLV